MKTRHYIFKKAGSGCPLLPSILLFFISLFVPLSLMALDKGSEQPINLEADSADIDDLKGISIYSGNVILTQGSMVIKSGKLTIHHDKNRNLEKAVANGSDKVLATFKQRPQGKNADFRARAKTMIYYLKKNKIHLLKKAFVQQDGDTFSGDRIIYDTKKETVTASSKKVKGKKKKNTNRVRVTIQPKSKQ